MLTLFILGAAIASVNGHDTIRMDIPNTLPNRTPVILIPGDGGSRIYGRYKKAPLICPGGKEWFLMWLNLKFLLPMTEYCFADYFKLNYNRTTRRTYNQPGVETKIVDWGGTRSVETLNDSGFSFSYYFFGLIKAMVEVGYTRNVDLRGAPYDFRKAPNDNNDFIPKMKSLVEETYNKNKNRRVMLLAHSLGNIYILHFLKQMSAEWKKKYVRSYVAVAAPIGGATKPLRLVTAGDTLGEPIFFSSYMREVERSMSSTPLLFPKSSIWQPHEVLVSRPGKNYTTRNYEQLFRDLKFSDGWEMYKDTLNLIDPSWVPDVDELFCFHGMGKKTPGQLVWKKDSEFPNVTPTVNYEDGDGTVNIRSLEVCRKWSGVRVQQFNGAEHLGILNDIRFIRVIVAALGSTDKYRQKP